MTAAELLAKHSIKVPSTKPGRYYSRCPHCSAQRKPHNRDKECLGITIADDGGVKWGCNHCGWTGPSPGDSNSHGCEFAAVYDYCDPAGNVLFQKVRNAPGREPRFWLRRPDGKGGWLPGTKGINTRVIYRLAEIVKAIAAGREITVVEGEKDADNLWRIGIPATCNVGGASEPGKKPKWYREHSEQLRGANIIVFNDNDAPGYAHADAVVKASTGIAARIRRLDLAKYWPDMPPKADVSDWLAAGHTSQALVGLIARAPDYEQTREGAEKSAPETSNGIDDNAELETLARLSPLDYERARKDAGKRLGISRLSLLDALVKGKRTELGLDGDDGKQGHAISFPEPEVWPEVVAGAPLFEAIATAIRRHVVLPDYARDACALWVAHTFLLDQLMITPRLCVRSPVRGCGKTSLLDIVGQIVYRPLPAANISASAVFRVVEGHRPCLLIDEADTFLAANEELRGVLNSGHRRGGAVLRNVGDNHEPRAFSTFSACAIALIGQLPGTLADRSVTIELTRRKPDEAVEPFRFDRVDELVVLRRKLRRWTNDNAEIISATEPVMPAGLYNRLADNWRPLLAIATVAGGDWLSRGHRAALAGADTDVDEGSRLELLLGDIRDIFDALAARPTSRDKDRITSAELIEGLVEITPRPWAEYGRSGKPITQNKLARLLKPLVIAPENIRVGDKVPKGYMLSRFEEAFARYLPPKGGFKPLRRYNSDGMGTSEPFQSATPESDVAVSKCEKSNNDGLCGGVADEKGDVGGGVHAEGGNGLAPGLSQRAILDLARWYIEQADAQQEGTGDVDSTVLDSGLRQVLAEQVLPEFIEVEFGRVMAEVFRV